MGATFSVKVEMEFAGEGFGWTDVTGDLRASVPMAVERGIFGSGPLDRVASTGRWSFALNNAANNSGGLEGYYSPGHPNARSGFDFGIRCRLTLTHTSPTAAIVSSSVANPSVITTSAAHGFSTGDTVVISGHSGSTPSLNASHVITVITSTTFSVPVNVTAGGTGGKATRNSSYVRFIGRLDVINPEPGSNRSKRTLCEVVDWMDEAAKFALEALPVQVNQRGDQVFAAILDSMVVQPQGREIQTGIDTFPYALDSARDESQTALSEFQKIALSELGYVFVKGSGTVVFESRKTRGTNFTNVQSFYQGISDIGVNRSRSSLVNKVQATAHPRRVDTTAAVLYSLQRATKVAGGETVELFGGYRDPAQLASRVGAVELQTPLVAQTDYTMNSAADGTGTDVTDQFTVVVDDGGNGAYFTVTNIGTNPAYVTKLQIRGKGIYDYEQAVMTAEDTTQFQARGVNLVRLNMPYQSDPTVAMAAANYIITLWKDPLTGVEHITFPANKTDDLLRAALVREISDRIGVIEPVSGLVQSRGFFINAVKYRISAGPTMDCTFVLAPADRYTYWKLGTTGQSELGQTTRLFHGLFVGHLDTPHQDVAHTDSAHVDTPHGDTLHQDTAHGDSAHSDTAHSDVPHADQGHQDTPHVDDGHADTPHTDETIHGDQAHTDSPHVDVWVHTDHFDYPFHWDQNDHYDASHDDIPHEDSDTHNDVSHLDIPHNDVLHNDLGHFDSSHSDVAHGDGSHLDSAHVDTPHGDVSHNDVVHQDMPHSDVGHGDQFI